MTASEVHRQLKEISITHIVTHRPPLDIQVLAEKLGITKQELVFHLDTLRTMGLLFHDTKIVILSEKGLQTELPKQG